VTSAALNTQRATTTRTLSGGGTIAFVTNRIDVNIPNGATVDFTLRIGLPQLELGAFAKSPILTTGAAATRLADVASITGTNFSSWFNAAEGTMVASASPQVSNVASCIIFDIATDASNRIGAEKLVTSGNASFYAINGGATQASTNNGAFPASAKFAGAYKADDFAASLAGGAVQTDTSGTLPTCNLMRIGVRVDSAQWLNGHLQSLTYYAKRLPNATIQSLTV
jgi:hypothetical protein